jgi:2-(3-amino-3-carboxypropyl)histidine synthase
MIRYDFEEKKVLDFLRSRKARHAGIQLPAGLKPFWPKISEMYRDAGVEPIFLGGCHGACDLADARAKELGCNVLVHYGHATMGLRTELPALFVETRVSEASLEGLKKFVKRVNPMEVGVFTTVQYLNHLPRVVKFLREAGRVPLVGKPGPRARYSGQVLGCDFGCIKAVSKHAGVLLYFGTGRFHPLGAALVSGKEVFIANPITGTLTQVSDLGNYLRSRRAKISKAASCQRFGVVTSVKRGQARFALTLRLVKALRGSGKQAELVLLDEVTPEVLGDYGFDAIVCAACPRIPIDDADRFETPLLTPPEAWAMLGVAKEPRGVDEIRPEDF